MVLFDPSSILPSGLQLAIIKPSRVFAQVPSTVESPSFSIVATITMDEEMRDELEITRHPVEGGSFISDHAFMLPVEVTIRAGFSNTLSSILGNGVFSAINTIGSNGFIADNGIAEYQRIRDLQSSRVPFSIVTGKRTYQNMLIQGLSVVTNAQTESSLIVTAHCREVIIVTTRTVTVATPDQYTAPIVPVNRQQLTTFADVP